LVLLDGFSQEELIQERRWLGGIPISDLPGSPLFVPISQWGHNDRVEVGDPRSSTFRGFTGIPRPPPARGLKVRTREISLDGDGVPVTLTPLGGGQEIGANS